MASANPIDVVQGKYKELTEKFAAFKSKQSPPAMILLEGLQGSVSGTWIGVASFWFNKNMASMNAPNPNMTPEMKIQMEKMAALQPKTVLASVRNFVVLFGVQSSLTAAFKHYRKGKDDIWNTVGPAFGAGAAFAVASGTPDQAPQMAMAFAAFSGLFYQVGEWTGNSQSKNSVADDRYRKGHDILNFLKLEKFHKNLRNGQLTDDTIMLWNDQALQDCKIPPGPRLLILHHLTQVRRTAEKTQGELPGRALDPSNPISVPAGYKVGKQ